jgi:glycosyltransferase involved in cell wall biosynthesis
MKKIFIIMAAYNEARRIRSVIQRTKKAGYKNIIVVDDGSTDSTYEQAKKEKIMVLKHIINVGKGAAVKTGCDYALKQGADILVLMDSDGQHKPEDIQRFIKALNGNDLVLGYRKLDRKMPPIMKLGNWGINLISRILFGLNIKDTQSGFRAMTKTTYQKIRWDSTDYSMESEMIANAGKKRLRIAQIPIHTVYYDTFKGTTMFDGLKIGYNLLKWRIIK